MSDSARRIPIGNIFYLFCYAWNRFKEGAHTRVAAENAPDTPHLFARALLAALEAIGARALDRDYVEREADLRHIRGKINISRSMRLSVTHPGYAACVFSELEQDVIPNQIIKATLKQLIKTNVLESAARDAVFGRARWFADVSDVRVDTSMFRRVKLHRNNGHYGLALAICELIHHCLLPDEHNGGYRFRAPEDDDTLMAKVFEDFLRNFWRLEQSEYKVSVEQLSWAAIGSPDHLALLPDMRTDVVLRRPGRTIIADAKYYRSAVTSYFGVDKLISANIYQIQAYMRAMERTKGGETEGLLVYPTTSRTLELDYRIDDRMLRVRTVDLSAPWPDIALRLRSILA
jgi:5-methylcytosine-specific restriction enzyme subunit McrC